MLKVSVAFRSGATSSRANKITERVVRQGNNCNGLNYQVIVLSVWNSGYQRQLGQLISLLSAGVIVL